eukprot:m.153878 g.153878  ORF g.153878 m.153878 type:complete len:554 (+) comp16246_c0_seq1:467-2128(+)
MVIDWLALYILLFFSLSLSLSLLSLHPALYFFFVCSHGYRSLARSLSALARSCMRLHPLLLSCTWAPACCVFEDATDATDLGAQEQTQNGQEPSGEDTLEVNPSNNDGNGQGEHDGDGDGDADADPESAQPASEQGQAPEVPPLPTTTTSSTVQPTAQGEPLMGSTPTVPNLLHTVSQTTSEDGQIVETVTVAEAHVSQLVGTDNTNIQDMQSVSGAQITVAAEVEPDTVNRTITIQGSADQVAHCKRLMEAELSAEQAAVAADSAGGEIITRVAYIPNEHVGRVIGRGGSTIRQIQELSGAHMDIAKECKPGESQREVTITGVITQVDHCEDLIHKKVAGEVLPPAPSRLPTGNETVISIPDDMVGRIIGRAGSTIREIQDISGAHLDVAKTLNTVTNRREITVRGNSQQVAYCVQMISLRLAELTGDFTTSYVEAPADVLQAGMMLQASMGPAFGQRPGQYGGYNQMYGQQQQQMTYAPPGYQQMYQQPGYNAQAYQQYMAQYAQYMQQQQQQQGAQQPQQAAQQYYQQPQQYYDYSQYYQQQQQAQQPQQ